MQAPSNQLPSMKTIIVGKSSVGKSTLLLRFIEGTFENQNTTIAIDYRYKQVESQGKKFNLELWDTAGQERYQTIVFGFFKLSKAACVVFDLSTEWNSKEIDKWLEQLSVHCGNEIPKVLLGNKSDLLTPADIEKKLQQIQPEINRIKSQYNCEYFTVSAKTGENINEAFEYLSEKLARELKSEGQTKPDERKTVILSAIHDSEKKKKEKKKCCE